MYIVFLAGGIASGKSTVARELERLGAWRIDLDRISRDVLEPGGECTLAIADAFGRDVLDPNTGALRRGLLAKRAFASEDAARQLEKIELPYIRQGLEQALSQDACASAEPPCAVVEIPLLDRMEDSLAMADEVVCVTCPLVIRRERAIGRGMRGEDFDARAARQPTDDYLRSKSDVEIANDGDEKDLASKVRAWWDAHERFGWKASGKRDVMHG